MCSFCSESRKQFGRGKRVSQKGGVQPTNTHTGSPETAGANCTPQSSHAAQETLYLLKPTEKNLLSVPQGAHNAKIRYSTIYNETCSSHILQISRLCPPLKRSDVVLSLHPKTKSTAQILQLTATTTKLHSPRKSLTL